MEFEHDPQILQEFLLEAEEIAEQIHQLLLDIDINSDISEKITELFRLFHSLKGGFGFVAQAELVDLCHSIEHLLDGVRNNSFGFDAELQQRLTEYTDLTAFAIEYLKTHSDPVLTEQLIQKVVSAKAEVKDLVVTKKSTTTKTETETVTKDPNTEAASKNSDANVDSVRVNTDTLMAIMDQVGELVLIRNRLLKINGQRQDDSIDAAVKNLNHVTNDLQDLSLSLRLVAVSKIFQRFPKMVRATAAKLGKEIEFIIAGKDTKLDKRLLEMLVDPLTHLVRNAIDHGVESTEEREAAGKPPQGTLVLSAQQTGDHVCIKVSDNGRGMDPQVLKQKAIQKQLLTDAEAQELSDDDAISLIFRPGFSTCNTVSDLSGRGVGMDVVRHKINQLSGSVEVNSELGVGSEFIINVPISLAIINVLLVSIGEQKFGLPVTAIVEILPTQPKSLHEVGEQEYLQFREQLVPLFKPKSWFNFETESTGTEKTVIMYAGAELCAVVVDDVLSQEEVVVKAIDQFLNDDIGITSATITGEGDMALILEISNLIDYYHKDQHLC